ncbi:MAG: TraR/DksA C4-type zinc finger protein [Planctomycetes bacterium]|nr:TraR/DksA C4-type zinc finger protein [Planctomycetota bacterium]
MIQRDRTALLRSLRRALERRAVELSRSVSADLEELGRSAEEHHLADMDDLGGDALDQEATFALMELGGDELEQLRWALARLDEGTYGVCEDCGDEVPEERLVALPLATRCLPCQVAAEAGAPAAAVGPAAVEADEELGEGEEEGEEEEEEEEPPPDERFALLEEEEEEDEEKEE